MTASGGMSDKNSILNPAIPHVSVIPEGLFPGRAIVIKGMVLTSPPHKFSINLCCGLLVEGDHTDNKALHFNPRFTEKGSWFSGAVDRDVVLNSLVNNAWGVEQRHDNVFQEGQAFQLRILTLKDSYKISVNGKHLCDFAHRIPVEEVQTLYIAGSVRVDFIEYQGQPSRSPKLDNRESSSAIQPQFGSSGSDVGPIVRPAVPFQTQVPGGFGGGRGRKLLMTATPKMNAERFHIDFLCQLEFYFHMRVQFVSPDKHAVVRNATKGGVWQAEEREHLSGPFPFQQGVTFDLVIAEEPSGFQVSVNGGNLFHFKHRYDPGKVDRICVAGDLTIQQFEIQ